MSSAQQNADLIEGISKTNDSKRKSQYPSCGPYADQGVLAQEMGSVSKGSVTPKTKGVQLLFLSPSSSDFSI